MTDPVTLPDATVKCYLLPDSSYMGKRKTPVIRGTSNPVWEEEFAYETTQEGLMEEQVLEITVKDERSYKVIGALRLGSIPSPTGSHKGKHRWMDSSTEEAAHWQEMLANPGKWVERWHDLRPSMKLFVPVSERYILQSIKVSVYIMPHRHIHIIHTIILYTVTPIKFSWIPEQVRKKRMLSPMTSASHLEVS